MPPQQRNYRDETQPEEYGVMPSATQRHNPWIVPFAIIVAGAFIGGGIYFSSGKSNPSTLTASASNVIQAINVNPVTANDHILGNPNADVTIVEFSDTECPYCKIFQDTMHRIINEYGKLGQVDWVYRHFPIAALHSKAPKEAEATECVNELGGSNKFWQYIDEVFAKTNSNDTLDPAQLPAIAKDVGLDVSKFNTCLASGKYQNIVTADSQDATRAGAQGTPYSILINNKTGEKVAIEGAQPYDVIKSVIDAALSEDGITTSSASNASASDSTSGETVVPSY